MKIVIDIDESILDDAKNGHVRLGEIADAVLSGTPLPKGHGRLIDVKQIVYERECVWETDGCCTTISTPNIDATPTIIEADKGGRE